MAARLARAGRPLRPGRAIPPEGRLSAEEAGLPALAEALADLGPLFTGFGRYLGSRLDLLPRRHAGILAATPDTGPDLPLASLEAVVSAELGRRPQVYFYRFDPVPVRRTAWTVQHDAWLAPDVPVRVVVARPDAAEALADQPLLARLQPWFDLPAAVFDAAVDDYVRTVRARLDLSAQAARLATLAADTATGGGFTAPEIYREHSTARVCTMARPAGYPLSQRAGAPDPADRIASSALARRLASAWLRQALGGRLVPFEFDADAVFVYGDHLVLTDAAFEPHTAPERAAFGEYARAVAEDDPDAAAEWLLAGAPATMVDAHEEELRRRLRQAVPFRDGEWSGDDRFAEHALVHWRMARLAGWTVPAHRLHLYRGLQALATITGVLAPEDDAVRGALQDERFWSGVNEARQAVEPSTARQSFDRRMQELLAVPKALDRMLTLAASGRLRVKLMVPESRQTSETRNRTVLLVALLTALAGTALVARGIAPAFGPGVEHAAALVVLALGAWLLVAAARF